MDDKDNAREKRVGTRTPAAKEKARVERARQDAIKRQSQPEYTTMTPDAIIQSCAHLKGRARSACLSAGFVAYCKRLLDEVQP